MKQFPQQLWNLIGGGGGKGFMLESGKKYLEKICYSGFTTRKILVDFYWCLYNLLIKTDYLVSIFLEINGFQGSEQNGVSITLPFFQLTFKKIVYSRKKIISSQTVALELAWVSPGVWWTKCNLFWFLLSGTQKCWQKQYIEINAQSKLGNLIWEKDMTCTLRDLFNLKILEYDLTLSVDFDGPFRCNPNFWVMTMQSFFKAVSTW